MDESNSTIPPVTSSTYRATKIENSSSSEDNSDDSDEGTWKRPKKHNNEDPTTLPIKTDNLPVKRQKNNIWSSVLSEQTLSDNVGRFCMKNKLAGDDERSVESYDYRLKNELERQEFHRRNQELQSSFRKRRHAQKSTKFYYKDSEPDEDIASRIADRLQEPKVELLARVVEQLGKKVAVELLYETEKIESTGGMLVMNCTRRRTPGGVYLQLLRDSKTVLPHQFEKIFKEEKKFADKRKKKARALKRRMEWEKPLPSVIDVALAESSTINNEANLKSPEDMTN